MPVTVDILRNERLVLYTWTAPIVPADFATTFEIAAQLYERVKQPVHAIFDATGVNNLPPNTISTFLHNQNSPLRHPKSGVFVGITTNRFVNTIGETAARMLPGGKLVLVSTLDEALAHIDEALIAEQV